jgi:radical SAM superfamily enzyme YgiQ (UPF0313 family)
MKILLVRPRPSPGTIGLQHVMIVEPLELEVMGALAGPGDEVRIVDMILEKEPVEHFIREFEPDVFCTTGYITHISVMIDYAKKAKAIFPDVVTVVGGVHIEKFPGDIESPYIDYRVVRNATKTFPLLLDFLKQGGPLPAGVLARGESVQSRPLPDYDFYFPFPRRDLTQRYRKNYFYVFHDKVALIKTSVGCPYKCSFCFCRFITGDHYHARPLEDVIAELKSIREEEIYIVDDDFLLSPKRVEEFISLLREHNIHKKFLVYGRADFIIENPGIIKAFQQEGLRTVIVGLESFKDSDLEAFNKKTSRNINEEALRVLHQNGVDCYAAIITSPDWTEADFKLAGDKMLQLGLKFINLQPLTPLPGVGFSIPESDLVISRKDFHLWDLAHVAIHPSHMSLEQYYRNILKLYDRITFNPKTVFKLMVKYPLYMQWRLARGLFKVRKQYLSMIKASAHEKNSVYTSHAI